MDITCVSELRARARRRLPKFAFDFLDGGAGSELGIARNTEAFDSLVLEPRTLVNIEVRDISVQLLGSRWAAPFGIAPIGLGNLIWPRSDEAIARAAAIANIPYILSTAGSTKLERIAEVAPGRSWFQLYVSKRDDDAADLISRVERAGYKVLVLTVDVPIFARRPRDVRNNFNMPLRITPSLLLQLLAHPSWMLGVISTGFPRFANLEHYAPMEIACFDWDKLKQLRERWPGKLVIKGLISQDDCLRAREAGCDAIIISNHGGRQLESAPATLSVLPRIRSAVGSDFALILDGGVRSGEDVIKAIAAGADFVLIGRTMMYAIAAYGVGAAPAVINFLAEETSRCLGQIGFTDILSVRQSSPIYRG